MSLQRRLARGILAVLALILVFFGLTSMSYWDIEGFVTQILPVNITIAQTYENVAARWTQLGEIMHESAKNDVVGNDIDYSARILEIEKFITRIEEIITDRDRLASIRQVKLQFADFKKQLNAFDLLIKSRNRILRKNASRRSKAAEGLRADVINLLERFKSMMVDLNTTLKNPDFQASLGNTSSLIEKISRIEKDLVLAETEIALYLSVKKDKDSTKGSGKSSAERVESRFRAILFLLDRSVQESATTLHRRVLSQVSDKVKGFFDSFLKLRNILETPESDLLETEDQIGRLQASLNTLKQQGVTAAASEARFFWSLISSVSDQLMAHAGRNYRLIQAFLAIVMLTGIYLSISFPRRVGGPLKTLSSLISQFRFGNDTLQVPASDISEIDTLGKNFQKMAEKLKSQAEVNHVFLNSISGLAKIYVEMHQTETRLDRPWARRESAVDSITQLLIDHCPEIDLVKTMVIENRSETEDDKKKGEAAPYFIRLGDARFSDDFVRSPEMKPYLDSVGVNPDYPEKIPLGAGLTGWYYENSDEMKLDEDDSYFYDSRYPPHRISMNPILTSREHEKGLGGSLITFNLVVPGKNDDEQRTRGLLFVYFMDPKINLPGQKVSFIRIIAHQIASIIETDSLLEDHDEKRIMDDQLNMAREIQENLLPQSIPAVPGLKINKVNKPAAMVGGDYFDFFDLGGNRLGVVIADASGKNVPAAIIMTVFKTTLSTMELANMTAGEVLSRANRIIAKNITNDRFITAMYVIIDAASGNVELASAGHNPAFVTSGRGHDLILREKSIKGLPLGILEDYQYQTISFSLARGDLLLLYTDGVTEARNVDEQEYGETRLKKFLSKLRGKNPAEDLLKEIQEFSRHAEQHDDITAVTVEYDGSAR